MSRNPSKANQLAAKTALKSWAMQNKITPANFARATSYSYNHAYQLLRGQARVSEALVARLLLAFGQEIAKEVATALHQESKTSSPGHLLSHSDSNAPNQTEH